MGQRRKLLVLFVFFLHCQVSHGSAVRIQISPAKWTGMKMEPGNVKCLLDQIDRDAMLIYFIKIQGPNYQLIANINNSSVISYGPNVDTTNIKANGMIDPVDKSKSYLSLDLPVLLKGTYICDVYYYDKAGILNTDRARHDLEAEKQDSDIILSYLLSRISTIENELTELKKENNIMKEEFKEFKQEQNKTDQPCGFSAHYDPKDTCGNQEALLFRHVDINIGDGYKSNTGVFTAPRRGMYAFHLTVATAGKNKIVRVAIFANNRIVGRLYAKDDYYWEQSSVSVTVMLLEGQTVRPVNRDGHNSLDINPHSSVFSGYLVQAM